MFAKFQFKQITLGIIVAILMSTQSSFAFQFTNIGLSPGGGYSHYDGETHYAQAEFDEPYGLVYWYVKGPSETGYGTVSAIDYGNGNSTISYFSHTFNNGSKEGTDYTITAYAYPLATAQNQSIVEQLYTVTVYDRDALLAEIEGLNVELEELLNDTYSLTDEVDAYEPVGSEIDIKDEIATGLFQLVSCIGSGIVFGGSLSFAVASGGTLAPAAAVTATIGLTGYVASMRESYKGFKNAFKGLLARYKDVICPQCKKMTTQAELEGWTNTSGEHAYIHCPFHVSDENGNLVDCDEMYRRCRKRCPQQVHHFNINNGNN